MAKDIDDLVQQKLSELRTPEDFVRYALNERGLTKEQFISEATINKSAKAVLAFARKYSKALGMTITEIRTSAGKRS